MNRSLGRLATASMAPFINYEFDACENQLVEARFPSNGQVVFEIDRIPTAKM